MGVLCEIYVVDIVMLIVLNGILLIVILWIMFFMSVELMLVVMILFFVFMYGFKCFRNKMERLDKYYYDILEKGICYLNDFFYNLKVVYMFNGY